MRNDRDPRDPDQARLETGLRVAWADPRTPPLAFRAALGSYKAALQAQQEGLAVDWAAMAGALLPALDPDDDLLF